MGRAVSYLCAIAVAALCGALVESSHLRRSSTATCTEDWASTNASWSFANGKLRFDRNDPGGKWIELTMNPDQARVVGETMVSWAKAAAGDGQPGGYL
jgi:hypothetical protein